MAKDLLGREIFTHNYVCQIGNDTTKGAHPENAGKIGKVVNFTNRGRAKIEFSTENDVKVCSVAPEFLVLVRFIDGVWTPDFAPMSRVDVEAQHAADRSGTYGESIRSILDKISPTVEPAEKSEPVIGLSAIDQAEHRVLTYLRARSKRHAESLVITTTMTPNGPVPLRLDDLLMLFGK